MKSFVARFNVSSEAESGNNNFGFQVDPYKDWRACIAGGAKE
jgi:hypothetical protein